MGARKEKKEEESVEAPRPATIAARKDAFAAFAWVVTGDWSCATSLIEIIPFVGGSARVAK